MLILDTTVISKVLRQAPDPLVVSWFEAQLRQQVFTTAVTEAEILYGISLLPKGNRRQRLLSVAHAIFDEDFRDHILAFGNDAARHYAQIAATRKLLGRPISQFDAMIASIAHLHGAGVATRNTSDFEHCDIDLINPWTK